MRMRATQKRKGVAVLDAVACTVITVGTAALGYGFARAALGIYSGFVEFVVGSPLM